MAVRADWFAAGGALGLALVVGLVVVAGPALPLGVLLAAAVVALGSRRVPFGFAAVCLALVLLPANGLRFGASVTYADVVLVGAVGVVGFGMLARWRFPMPPGELVLGAGLLLTSVLLSIAFEPMFRPSVYIFSERAIGGGQGSADVPSWLMASRLCLALLVVPYLIAVTLTTWGRVRVATNAWMTGASLSALVALLAAAGFDYQETITGGAYAFEFGVGENRFAGLAVHPTTLGLASAMAAPVAMVKLAGRRGWAWAGALCLLVAAVVVSGSRAPLGALVLGGAFVAWKVPATRSRLAVALLAAMAVAWTQSARVEQSGIVQRLTGQAVSAAQSDRQRGSAFEQGIDYGLDRPFGWGFDIIRGAHNAELAMLLGGGVLALAAFLILLFGVARVGTKVAADRHVPEDVRMLAMALLGSLAVWFAAVQLQSNVIDRWLFVPAGLLLGMWFVRLKHPS